VASFWLERGLGVIHFFACKKRLSQAGTGQFMEVQVLSGWRAGAANISAEPGH